MPTSAPTPAERALGRPFTMGQVTFDVSDLSVVYNPDRSVALTYSLIVVRQGHEHERWAFTLRRDATDKSFTDIFESQAPDPERLHMLVHLVRAQVVEWWDTKGHNRRSANMARRLP